MPTYTGTPSYVLVSFRWIDANGSKGSTPYLTTSARATTAAIEAMAAALAAASNANLYAVEVTAVTEGAMSKSTAIDESRESVNDFINTLVREPTSRKTQEVAIPAPLDALFVEGSQVVDTTNVLYQAVNTAADTLLVATYEFISTRFSEHRKINEKTNF